jgi:predicted small metal-binding protein
MTCNKLGGPCDFQLNGNTADEVIKIQDKHLREIVAEGDEEHKDALKEMKDRWKHPLAGMGWYRKIKRDFAAIAED